MINLPSHVSFKLRATFHSEMCEIRTLLSIYTALPDFSAAALALFIDSLKREAIVTTPFIQLAVLIL